MAPVGATGTLIVDDEEDIRLLVRAVIRQANEGLSVVGEAATGEEAVERCREHQPDVVLLDYRLPDISGLEVAERILAERPAQNIILFSAFLDADTIRKAAEVGVRACISKADVARLPEALWKYSTT
ncbi:MAG: pdtaR [Acidimicrobiales bacterium]|jgi:DNA-binding NarL/FixJ family response regulator|nr:pdtaR [Acidimicrobiales bacterium]